MYLPKPIYEALPYIYFLIGILFLAGASYISHWFTGAPIYMFFGYFCLLSGIVVVTRRFVFRRRAHGDTQGAVDATAPVEK